MNVDDQMIQHSDDGHEALRAINHLNGPSIPAPTICTILGNVYETDGGNPKESVIAARHDLGEGALCADRAGHLLQSAQNAIAGQGQHGPKVAR